MQEVVAILLYKKENAVSYDKKTKEGYRTLILDWKEDGFCDNIKFCKMQ